MTIKDIYAEWIKENPDTDTLEQDMLWRRRNKAERTVGEHNTRIRFEGYKWKYLKPYHDRVKADQPKTLSLDLMLSDPKKRIGLEKVAHCTKFDPQRFDWDNNQTSKAITLLFRMLNSGKPQKVWEGTWIGPVFFPEGQGRLVLPNAHIRGEAEPLPLPAPIALDPAVESGIDDELIHNLIKEFLKRISEVGQIVVEHNAAITTGPVEVLDRYGVMHADMPMAWQAQLAGEFTRGACIGIA